MTGPAQQNPANVIIGAGQAGGHAAIAMREAGWTGRIVLIGEETHPPYERPPLSKQALTDDPAPPPTYVHKAERYAASGVELLLGTRALGIDPAARVVHVSDGAELRYAALLIASGGQARRLVVPGHERVITLRTLEDATALRRTLLPGAHVVCVGAGVIGLEIAASACRLGCEVTVIETAATAMGRSLTADFAAWIARLHHAAGVSLRFGTGLTAVGPREVVCSDGTEIAADVVVAGIGMTRNTDLAAAAGLELDGGVVVDACGRASLPDIYAAGDIAAFWHPTLGRRMRLESWQHAQNHGIAVGRAMAGQPSPYDDIPWFWSDQHGRTIQVAGLPQEAVTTVLRNSMDDTSFAGFHLDARGHVVGVTGVDAPREVRAGQALIRAARPIDAGQLADPRVTPQKLAALAR